MNVDKNRQHAILSWLFVIVLLGLCATLGVFQYRWIGEVNEAEHEKLRGSLQTGLRRISDDFDSEIGSLSSALSIEPSPQQDADSGTDVAVRYARWLQSTAYSGLVNRLAIATSTEDAPSLRILNNSKGAFEAADWPPAWTSLRNRLADRTSGDPSLRVKSFNAADANVALIELPQFGPRGFGPPDHGFPNHGPGGPFPANGFPRGQFPQGQFPPNRPGFDHREPGPGGPPREQARERAWTVIELNLDYVRTSLLPDLIQRHLGDGSAHEYHLEVVARSQPSTVIYDSQPDHGSPLTHSDASTGIFEAPFDGMFQPEGPGPRRPRRAAMSAAVADRGRWVLSAQHRTGSLDALVAQTSRRDLSVTGGILLLMLAAAAALIQFSRRAQRLAELQMEFVAGVSHELRTPLSVIRMAAHNLGVRVISNASQVQRYGALIEEQSEKLTAIVEQVLLFSNARAGRVIGSKEAVGVEPLIADALSACSKAIAESRCQLESTIEPDLPPVAGDATALKHAVLNLITNAVKYGAEGGWIGISARLESDGKIPTVEIAVTDRGPGIPSRELDHIFDPFYRGKMAVADQIHGTGLGLSLVKRIIKAHGGTVAATSEPGKETKFVIRIPAAPAEQIDEFADSINRR